MSEMLSKAWLAPKKVCALVEGSKGDDFARELRRAWALCPSPPELTVQTIDEPTAGPSDVALVATSSARALHALERCPAPVALVSSSGFGEAGAEGRLREDQLRDVAKERGIRILGPNCGGAFNLARQLVLGHQPSLRRALEGDLGATAVIAQGGSALSTVVSHCREAGLPLAHGISTGNECDVTSAELLRATTTDADIQCVLWVVEGIRNPAETSAALEALQQHGILVCVLALGRTNEGQRQSESHTGQRATPTTTLDAVFERFGVLRVDSFGELATAGMVAQSLVKAGVPRGSRAALLATSGGQAALLADRAQHLSVTPALGTPLDVGPRTKEEPRDALISILREIESQPDVGATIVACSPSIRRDAYLCAVRDLGSSLPRFILGPGHGPVHPTLSLLSQWLRPRHDAPASPAPLDARQINRPPERVVYSGREAASAARDFGGSVVLKLASDHVPHKTVVGGVLHGLNTPTRVSKGFALLSELPDYGGRGVLVQQFVRGEELFVGSYWAEGYGTVILIGTYGTALLAPLTPERAAHAIESEMRRRGIGISPSVLEHGASEVAKISAFTHQQAGDLLNADFNPLILNEDGAWVVDAWFEWKGGVYGRDRGAA